jgi:hypothetical protein
MASAADAVIAQSGAPLLVEAAGKWRDLLTCTDCFVLSFANHTDNEAKEQYYAG